jgi:hypothetical protein
VRLSENSVVDIKKKSLAVTSEVDVRTCTIGRMSRFTSGCFGAAAPSAWLLRRADDVAMMILF